MRTACPAWTFPRSLIKYSAVFPAKGMEAASSQVVLAGFAASTPSSGMQIYSAWAPRAGSGLPKTWLPTWNRFTSLPTASTSPARSIPNLRTLGLNAPNTNSRMGSLDHLGANVKLRTLQSEEVTVVVCHDSSTSFNDLGFDFLL
jgi:hypothetical protein